MSALSPPPPSLIACAHNAQRMPAIKELLRRRDAGLLASLTIFIPSGARYEAFGRDLAALGVAWRHARKAEYEALLVAAAPDVVLTLGWPFILTRASLDGAPATLFVNSHPSLLPRHRGFSPFWGAIRDGDAEAGATVHRITPGIDDGPVLLATRFELSKFDTYLSCKRRTFDAEADGVGRALDAVAPVLRDAPALAALFVPQDEAAANWTEKRGPRDSEIDASRPLADLYDAIRYCDPDSFPAYFYVDGERVEITLRRAARPAGARDDAL